MKEDSSIQQFLHITCISDMHGEYNRLNLPGGDLLICAGDSQLFLENCEQTLNDGLQFCEWLNKQEYTQKIFVAGNHDLVFEKYDQQIRHALINYPSVKYLRNEQINIEINGTQLQIFGSPLYVYRQTKKLQFFISNEESRSNIVNNIPENTDILITHGPLYGICDQNSKGVSCGCQILKQAINKIKPKLHVFGHIHESQGIIKQESTNFINAAVMLVGECCYYSTTPLHHTTFKWCPQNNIIE
ncbi:Calcineurin-like_phosphoesterase [Hexamita inflata]|uniref:Calcineurin-like_phosphoesterase n=1 Tax=Hexamita inflata TaxID=28002 RepID=A0ABP1GFH4_9EUKA